MIAIENSVFNQTNHSTSLKYVVLVALRDLIREIFFIADVYLLF